MDTSPIPSWQPSLLASGVPISVDPSFAGLARVTLGDDSWVDHLPGWVRGSDRLFEEIVVRLPWEQRSRRMYDRRITEPRLTWHWEAASGSPLDPEVLETVRVALGRRYSREFDSVWFNLYRDGRDSVAWHADRIPEEVADPIVALVSLGEPRRFLLRPKGGGASRAFLLGRGDLLVTGGRTQRDWDHGVPKVARAGPRISLAYRHGMRSAAHDRGRVDPDAQTRPSAGS
jgi:alkylated DNA repair dioxygenase AlkB